MPQTRLSQLQQISNKTANITVLDGGFATALESAGYVLNTPLWSADLLVNNPQTIKDVHAAYYRAGADVAITASYQGSTSGLVEYLGVSEKEAGRLVEQSVRLAREAVNFVSTGLYQNSLNGKDERTKLLVAGSVGPYGAYLANGSEYTGIYPIIDSNSNEQVIEYLKDFHRPRIASLLSAGADLLAIETLPNYLELQALVSLLNAEFMDARAWFTFSLKDSTHISDGTKLAEVVKFVVENAGEGLVGVGVNCVPPDLVTDAIKVIKGILNEYPEQAQEVDVIVYPNKGEVWDAALKQWKTGAIQTTELQRSVCEWIDLGATAIGGCCRMGVDDIQIIKKAVEEYQSQRQ